jgi:hypothetical protein
VSFYEYHQRNHSMDEPARGAPREASQALNLTIPAGS